MEFKEGQTVGIDLGTTFSSVAQVNDQGDPVPVVNEEDEVAKALVYGASFGISF